MKRMTKKTTGWLVMAAARIEGKAMMAAARTRQALTLAAAAAVMGLATASCSSDDGLAEEPVQQPAENTDAVKKYTMTVTASKGGDATTRALTYDGDTKTINATWTAGDKVYVYNISKEAAIGGYLEAKSAGETVTLEGDLTGTFAAGDQLVLAFPQFDQDYTHQDGTLATIASTCDYTWGRPIVSDVTNGKITVDTGEDPSVQFMNQQAIVKFRLLDKTNASIKATSLTIDARDASSNAKLKQTFVLASNETTCGPVTITPSSAKSVIYAALGTYDTNESYDYTLTATDEDGCTYTYTKEDVNFEWGKYYEIKVKMEKQWTDLSMVDCAGNTRATMTTANCYMIHTAGAYKLPLVYGNAIKNGEVNTVAYQPGGTTTDTYCANFTNHEGNAINAPWITKSAEGTGVDKGMGITIDHVRLFWQDAKGLITELGIDGDYLTLTVGKDATEQEGNALVAVMDAANHAIWSWHIWVTKQTFAAADLTTVATGDHNYIVTPVNLGWVGEPVSPGYCTYYQWGRKDPFIPNKNMSSKDDHTVYNISNSSVEGINYFASTTATIANNITSPTTHYYDSESGGPCNTTYYNMWDAQQTGTDNISTATVKTVYDPCPPGFCVPTSNLLYYIADGYSRIDSNWDSTNKGKTWSTVTSGNALYFPASGNRSASIGSIANVGTYGRYWSASPHSGMSSRNIELQSAGWMIACPYRAFGYPVRAVAEE